MAEPRPVSELTVTVRYFAAARAAAGIPEESLTVSAGVTVVTVVAVPAGRLSGDPAEPSPAEPSPATVDAVLEAAIARHGPTLATVLRRCSFLLDEVAVHGTETQVRSGQILDVLPPFAGG